MNDFGFSDFGLYRPGRRNLVGTGVGQLDAQPLTRAINHFGTVAPNTGAILPMTPASLTTDIIVINRGQNGLNVYPALAGQIEGLPVNAPYSVPSGTAAVFVCFNDVMDPGLQWSVVALTVLAGIASPVSMGPNPPANPTPGWLWWDTVGGNLYVYYNDGNSSQWVVAVTENSPTSVTEAPIDGQIYGRNGQIGIWTPVVPISGATMSGPLVQPHNFTVASNGGSVTIPANCTWQEFTQTAAVANYSITMPTPAVDGQDLIIATRGAIAPCTILPASGQTVDSAPIALAANTSAWFRWIASLGTWALLGSGAASFAAIDATTQTSSPSSGFNITIPNNCSTYILTGAATLATGTIVMPSAPTANQLLRIVAQLGVTAFTLNANVGQTINGVPTTMPANTSVQFIYNGTTWYRTL